MRARGDFGWKVKTENGRLKVSEAFSGGAAERGGVSPGDEIVAAEGIRATEDFLRRIATERGPRARVRVTVFRRERLLFLRLTLGSRKAGVWKIAPVEKARPAAKRLRLRWLRAPVSA